MGCGQVVSWMPGGVRMACSLLCPSSRLVGEEAEGGGGDAAHAAAP